MNGWMRSFVFGVILCVPLFCPVFAGVTPDGTMGTGVSTVGAGPSYLITSGTQRGGNLFHSFQTFTIGKGENANFMGAASVRRIINRVTGGGASTIDGYIRSLIPDAAFYFINPAGIILKENARLDFSGATVMPGSVFFSTADYLQLGTDGRFDATNPANDVLTASAPSAFGFLSDSPAGIEARGNLWLLSKDGSGDGRRMSLVGGDITIREGLLWAADGQIDIVSVGSAGRVAFGGDGMDTSTFDKLGFLTVSDGARIMTDDPRAGASAGAGKIFIRAGSFVLEDTGSALWSRVATGGSGDSRGIDIQVRGEVAVQDNAVISSQTFGSGDAGDIRIEAESLKVRDGGGIVSSSSAGGNAGDVDIRVAGELEVSGSGTFPSRIVAMGFAGGNGGDIKVRAERLNLADGGAIQASGNFDIFALSSIILEGDAGIFAAGGDAQESASDFTIRTKFFSLTNGGFVATAASQNANAINLSVEAERIEVTDGGFLETLSADGSQEGGDLSIQAEQVMVRDGGRVQTVASGSAPGGDIRIEASESLRVDGGGDSSTGIFTTTTTDSSGEGGDLTIVSPEAALSNSGSVGTDTSGRGRGGDLRIEASKALSIDGGGDIGTHIFTRTMGEGGGDGGDLLIVSPEVLLQDFGGVDTETVGSGKGGNIRIEGEDSVTLSEAGRISSTATSTGDTGNIAVETPRLTIAEEGIVTCESAGAGAVGNIDLRTAVLVVDRGFINTSALENTAAGSRGGDISIAASDSFLLRGSGDKEDGIYAQFYGLWAQTQGAGDGGGIFIETPTLTVTDDAMINVDTYGSGDGGDIRIAVDTLQVTNGGTIVGQTRGAGSAGSIRIDATERILVTGPGVRLVNSWIYTATHSSGAGGDIFIHTPELIIDSRGLLYANTLGNDTRDGNTLPDGPGGSIEVLADRLFVRDGGAISAGSESDGDGGSVIVHARELIDVHGEPENPPPPRAYEELAVTNPKIETSGIYATTEGSGRGGFIDLNAHDLFVYDAGRIESSTRGVGRGGVVSVKTFNAVSLLGEEAGPSCGIFSTASGDGKAGAISMDTPMLLMKGLAEINTDSSAAGQGGDIDLVSDNMSLEAGASVSARSSGAGDAGAIRLFVSDKVDLEDAAITTEAVDADGGNISIEAGKRLYLLRSEVTATVGGGLGDGGNIFIDPEFVILNQGKIIANAYGGRGGNIRIIAGVFLPCVYSEVAASSQLGIDGTVEIDAPDVDLTGGLVMLPESFLDVSGLLWDRCAVARTEEISSLFVTGKGGMPVSPDGFLPSVFFDFESEEKAEP